MHFFTITVVVINDIENPSPFSKIHPFLHDELKIS